MQANKRAWLACFEWSGWKRAAMLVASGMLLTSAFAPFFFWPAVAVSFSILLLYVRSAASPKRAFWDGWCFGLGHFTTGLYWFAHALLTDAEQFAWLIPFAIFGIPSVLGIYIGLVACLTKKLARNHVQCWLWLSILWLAAEFARAYLFSGFPWNLLGYVWAASDVAIQQASVFGVWGLSLITILIASSPALLLEEGRVYRRFRYGAVVMSALVFCVMLAAGWWRLESAPEAQNSSEGGYVRLVQGNIAQQHKWNPDRQMKIFRTYAELSKWPSEQKPSLIVWPESAIPFFPEEQKWVQYVMADIVPDGAFLVSGALRAEPPKLGSAAGFSLWNSLFAFGDDGKIVQFYDKNHLVPFGEYIPLRSIIPFKKITAGTRDFARGDGLKTLQLEGIPAFSPLICYEVIFPDHVIADSSTEAELMINITNDAWFGDSTAPHHHLHMARFRAAEEGVPLLRSANTGISAVVDAYGRMTAVLGLNEQGVLDAPMPKPLGQATIYRIWGVYVILALLSVLFVIMTLHRKR